MYLLKSYSTVDLAGILESLPLPLPRVLPEELLMKKEVESIDGMFPGPSVHEECQFTFILCFVLVYEHLDDMSPHQDLEIDETGGGFVGTLLVDRLASRHSQGHDQIASLLEEYLAGNGEVLDTWNGVALDLESRACVLQLLDCRVGHVEPCEGGVSDPDYLHGSRSGVGG